MKNFRQEEYKKNRNSLRYLLTKTLTESPITYLDKIFKDKKSFIKNKTELLTENNSKFFYELNIANKLGFVVIDISKDNLIKAKVSYKNTKEIKTRDFSEVINLINSVLFT